VIRALRLPLQDLLPTGHPLFSAGENAARRASPASGGMQVDFAQIRSGSDAIATSDPSCRRI
jgi:hypothetical protein